MKAPMLLSVETSGVEGSIALISDQALIEERLLEAQGRRHAQTLVSEVERLLRTRGVQPHEIDAVAVSFGPGSFTGLRVGVVFAKTFAWVNEAKLIAVDTLQAIAQRVCKHDCPSPVTVISDAQRGDVFVNEYRWEEQTHSRQPIGKVRIEAVSEIAARSTTAGAVVTGPGLVRFSGDFGGAAQLTRESLWQPRAASVAEIGTALLQQEQFADLHTLEPLYIRRSYAEEKRGSTTGSERAT